MHIYEVEHLVFQIQSQYLALLVAPEVEIRCLSFHGAGKAFLLFDAIVKARTAPFNGFQTLEGGLRNLD